MDKVESRVIPIISDARKVSEASKKPLAKLDESVDRAASDLLDNYLDTSALEHSMNVREVRPESGYASAAPSETPSRAGSATPILEADQAARRALEFPSVILEVIHEDEGLEEVRAGEETQEIEPEVLKETFYVTLNSILKGGSTLTVQDILALTQSKGDNRQAVRQALAEIKHTSTYGDLKELLDNPIYANLIQSRTGFRELKRLVEVNIVGFNEKKELGDIQSDQLRECIAKTLVPSPLVRRRSDTVA